MTQIEKAAVTNVMFNHQSNFQIIT